MTTLLYCPRCWPADLGVYDERHRCLDCGTTLLHATPEKHIELLQEQNDALAIALQQAMEELGARRRARLTPTLRLVHCSQKGRQP